jgi:hypothetical protein
MSVVRASIAACASCLKDIIIAKTKGSINWGSSKSLGQHLGFTICVKLPSASLIGLVKPAIVWPSNSEKRFLFLISASYTKFSTSTLFTERALGVSLPIDFS